MQAVLKQEIERLEGDIRDLEPRTLPLSERFKGLYNAEAERNTERKRLLGEWANLATVKRGRLYGDCFAPSSCTGTGHSTRPARSPPVHAGLTALAVSAISSSRIGSNGIFPI